MLWTCFFKFKQAWQWADPISQHYYFWLSLWPQEDNSISYNHTNKTTYFLKLQGQKHFKTRAGSFSGNLPNYSGIIISINSSSFTSVDTPSEWRQQFCSKGWIPQQILSINYHPSKDIAIPLHLHIWSCFQYLPTDFEWKFLIWGAFVFLCCCYDNNSDLFLCKTTWESSPKKVHQFEALLS